MRTTELTRSHRRRLTRYAHRLARSGRYENAMAVIEELRSHKDFDPASHENSAFRAALEAICKFKEQIHARRIAGPTQPHRAALRLWCRGS